MRPFTASSNRLKHASKHVQRQFRIELLSDHFAIQIDAITDTPLIFKSKQQFVDLSEISLPHIVS